MSYMPAFVAFALLSLLCPTCHYLPCYHYCKHSPIHHHYCALYTPLALVVFTCPFLLHLPGPTCTTRPTYTKFAQLQSLLCCMYYMSLENQQSPTHTNNHQYRIKWSSCHLTLTRWCKLQLSTTPELHVRSAVKDVRWLHYFTRSHTDKAQYGTHPTGTLCGQ
jgi:hypothetical protein